MMVSADKMPNVTVVGLLRAFPGVGPRLAFCPLQTPSVTRAICSVRGGAATVAACACGALRFFRGTVPCISSSGESGRFRLADDGIPRVPDDVGKATTAT